MAERRNPFALPSFSAEETPTPVAPDASPRERPVFTGGNGIDGILSSLNDPNLTAVQRGRLVRRGILRGFEDAGRKIPNGDVQRQLRDLFSGRNR